MLLWEINWALESGKLAFLLWIQRLGFFGVFWNSSESTFQADLSKQKNFWNIFWIRRFRIGCLTWWTSYWTVENLNVPSKCISPPLCLQGSVSSLRRALGLDAIKKMSTLPRLLCSRPQQPQWLSWAKWQKNRQIRSKNSWKQLIILYACSSLTESKYETNTMTNK